MEPSKQQDTKKQTPSPLFGGTSTNSIFSFNKDNKTAEQPKPSFGGLFGSSTLGSGTTPPTSSIFGGPPTASIFGTGIKLADNASPFSNNNAQQKAKTQQPPKPLGIFGKPENTTPAQKVQQKTLAPLVTPGNSIFGNNAKQDLLSNLSNTSNPLFQSATPNPAASNPAPSLFTQNLFGGASLFGSSKPKEEDKKPNEVQSKPLFGTNVAGTPKQISESKPAQPVQPAEQKKQEKSNLFGFGASTNLKPQQKSQQAPKFELFGKPLSNPTPKLTVPQKQIQSQKIPLFGNFGSNKPQQKKSESAPKEEAKPQLAPLIPPSTVTPTNPIVGPGTLLFGKPATTQVVVETNKPIVQKPAQQTKTPQEPTPFPSSSIFGGSFKEAQQIKKPIETPLFQKKQDPITQKAPSQQAPAQKSSIFGNFSSTPIPQTVISPPVQQPVQPTQAVPQPPKAVPEATPPLPPLTSNKENKKTVQAPKISTPSLQQPFSMFGNTDQNFSTMSQNKKDEPQAPKLQSHTLIPLQKLAKIFSVENENFIFENAQKIQKSLSSYLTIDSSVDISRAFPVVKFYPQIEANEGANKLINDFTQVISRLLKAPQTSYKLLGDLFISMLEEQKIQQKLFDKLRLREDHIKNLRIYQIDDDRNLNLDWEQGYAGKLTCDFVNYYTSLICRCLNRIENSFKPFRKTELFSTILGTFILLNQRAPPTESLLIIDCMRSCDLRLSRQLNRCLLSLLDSTSSNEVIQQFVSQQSLVKQMPIVDQLPINAATKIYQRFLLRALDLQKPQMNKHQQLVSEIEKTSSKLLMPFKAIVHKLQKNKKIVVPFQKDLFEQINGPQWVQWLSLYLGEQNLMLNEQQIHYFVKALKSLQFKNINKILSKQSQIRRLIHIIFQQGQIKNFYDIISSIVYDQNSMLKVEAEFFKQGSLQQGLRLMAEQIRKYPNCEWIDEDLPQIHGKAVYFLTTLQLSPERAFKYENSLFDINGFIQNSSERCDLVCHLVIDILAYFSGKGLNEQITQKCFSAIVSLLSFNETKSFMGLAMNVNRPQFEFFNKSFPKQILDKIDTFLISTISSQQFYDSLRVPDQSFSLSKAYTLRYSIEKYLFLTEKYVQVIPLYWFSNCLKMSIRQSFNPQLIEMILSKLRIYSQNDKSIESLSILTSLVEACNNSNFYKNVKQNLAASSFYFQNKLSIMNKKLAQNPDINTFSNVFYSLSIVRAMLELHKIRNNSQKSMPRHFMSQLLSSLQCLNEIDRQYFQEAVDLQVVEIGKSSLPPILSLLSLICEDSAFVNSSSLIKTQWVYDLDFPINLQEIKKIHQRTSQNIDFSVIRDVLVHSHYKELDDYQNIPSLAYNCLDQLLQENKEVSLESLIYFSIPKGKNENILQNDFNSSKKQIVQQLAKALQSPVLSLSRNAWKLLLVLRKNPNNSKLAQSIFQQYQFIGKKYPQKVFNLQYLSEYLLCEVKQRIFTHSQLISQILEEMNDTHVNNLLEMLQTYTEKSVPVQTLNQFQRLMIERQILRKVSWYQTLKNMMQVILNELYSQNQSFPLLTRHTSLIFELIVNSDCLNTYNPQIAPKSQYRQLKVDNPRLFGSDILQKFICNPTFLRDQLIQQQIQNVVNWVHSKLDAISKTTTSFLSVMLSIDQTFYANHDFKVKNREHSQLFCQLHMGVNGYKAHELVGKTEGKAIANIKAIIDLSLGKLQDLRKHSNVDAIVSTYAIINLGLNWLKSNKSVKKTQLNLYCKKVVSLCFNWLGEAAFEPMCVKLLMTCVKISQDQLSQDFATKIKQTIVKTYQSIYTLSSDIKQQLLSLFLIVVPERQEINILEFIARIWSLQQNSEYFYNQSKVLLKLCELYPIQMCKLKVLTKSDLVSRIQDHNLPGVRYNDGFRTNQSKCWLWILKIAAILMQNGRNSTIVVHQVSRFVQNSKRRLVFTLNQPKQQFTLKSKSKQMAFELTLAQLDELQITLEFITVLAESKMWVQINRLFFQELTYYLLHRTIVIFAPKTMTDRLRKKYVPQSINQKILWKLYPGANNHNDILDPYSQQTNQLSENKATQPSTFLLAASLRYNDCLKVWLLSCSVAMRNSCFVREYFSKPIINDLKGNVLKYSLTHWDHLNRAILEIINSVLAKMRDWDKWSNKNGMLQLLEDSFNSAQVFTETGYFYSTINMPRNEDELKVELASSLSFALEMGGCHLVSQMYFRNKNGTFSKESLLSFQDKLMKLANVGTERLSTARNSILELGEIMQIGRQYLEKIQI